MKLAQPRVSRPTCYDTRPFAGLPRAHPSLMQLLFDLLPVVFFFIAYKMAGIYVATAVLIVGVLVQTAISWFRHKKVSPMLLTSAILVLVFGGLTLLIHDATFIKWKPTIVNCAVRGRVPRQPVHEGADHRPAPDGRAGEARTGVALDAPQPDVGRLLHRLRAC